MWHASSAEVDLKNKSEPFYQEILSGIQEYMNVEFNSDLWEYFDIVSHAVKFGISKAKYRLKLVKLIYLIL